MGNGQSSLKQEASSSSEAEAEEEAPAWMSSLFLARPASDFHDASGLSNVEEMKRWVAVQRGEK